MGKDKDISSFIKLLFEKAKDISSDYYYTKAEAEYGLARIELLNIEKANNGSNEDILDSVKNDVVNHLDKGNKTNTKFKEEKSYTYYKNYKICYGLNELVKSHKDITQKEVEDIIGETCPSNMFTSEAE